MFCLHCITYTVFYDITIPIKMKGFFNVEISIPIKTEDFFNAEISIYSRAEFFIYLFEDLYKDFLMKTPCP